MKITNAQLIGDIEKHVIQRCLKGNELVSEKVVLWAVVGMQIKDKWCSANMFKSKIKNGRLRICYLR